MGLDIMAGLSAFGGGLVGYLVPFLFVLTIVVFFHELGHFLVARWCGIRVLTFSLGFGPELVGFYDRYGTRWKISAVPLGGYVKFFGDENAASAPDHAAAAAMSESEKKDSFIGQKVGARAAVVAAGPIANFMLAIAIFAGIFMIVGKQTTSARVDAVQPGSAAATAGFQPGDLVLSIDGEKIDSFADMQRIVSISSGEPLKIVVERQNSEVALTATPQLKEIKDNFGNIHRLGVLGISRSMAAGDIKTQKLGPVAAVSLGAQETWFVVDRTLSYIGGVFAGREAADQLGGPIRIAQVSGAGGERRFRRAHPSHRRVVGLDRPVEPVPDPAARWRSPFVLWNRGGSRPAPFGAGPGGRVPDWAGNRRHVDDFCNL